jgi:MFS family permease
MGARWAWPGPASGSWSSSSCSSAGRDPLIDLGLFRNVPYVLVTAGGAVGNTALCLMLLLSTIYLQQVRGLSPLMAGVVFLGPALANAGAGLLAGRLGARGIAPNRVMGAALAIGALALFGMSLLSAWPAYLSVFALAGFGLGISWTYTSVGTQAVVPEAQAGGAPGMTLAVWAGRRWSWASRSSRFCPRRAARPPPPFPRWSPCWARSRRSAP